MRNPSSSLIKLLTLLQLTRTLRGLAISLAHCEKNISVKYQVPVTKTRLVVASDANHGAAYAAPTTEQYIDYEERLRWDVIQICCPGHRTIIFGLCEAICRERCPRHSACAQPNKCKCLRGYEPSHHPNKEHQLICRPVCAGGCPAHSHCVAPNVCECRTGYRDVSSWFRAKRCERVNCGPRHRYDASQRGCVRIGMGADGRRFFVKGLPSGGGADAFVRGEEEEEDEQWKMTNNAVAPQTNSV